MLDGGRLWKLHWLLPVVSLTPGNWVCVSCWEIPKLIIHQGVAAAVLAQHNKEHALERLAFRCCERCSVVSCHFVLGL